VEKFEIDKESNSVVISVNPKIFPLEVIYSASYVFLDKAYVMMDGNPQENIAVQLKAKNSGEDLQSLALEFNNELVSYSVYVVQAARTSEIRKAIVQRALATIEESDIKLEEEFEPIEDPLGIAKPWTEESAKGLKPIEEMKSEECAKADE
jgi:His-Xaa-Ser system protein HxsD